jgi:hypothetical protein
MRRVSETGFENEVNGFGSFLKIFVHTHYTVRQCGERVPFLVLV